MKFGAAVFDLYNTQIRPPGLEDVVYEREGWECARIGKLRKVLTLAG